MAALLVETIKFTSLSILMTYGLQTKVDNSVRYFILTATISPHPSADVALVNPHERERQYIAALRFWGMFASQRGDRVLLGENSSANLDGMRRSLKDLPNVTIGSFPAGNADGFEGIGSLEANLLDDMIETIHINGHQPPFSKITGRLTLKNPQVLAEASPSNREIYARVRGDYRLIDTRFFTTTTQAWVENFTGMGRQVVEAEGIWLEHVMADRTLSALGGRRLDLRRYSSPLKVRGSSGTSGDIYGGWSQKLKQACLGAPVESFLKKFASRKYY